MAIFSLDPDGFCNIIDSPYLSKMGGCKKPVCLLKKNDFVISGINSVKV